MKRLLMICAAVAVAAFLQPLSADESEAALLASFKAFAEAESKAIVAEFSAILVPRQKDFAFSHAPLKAVNPKGERTFFFGRFDGFEESYGIDLRRTDSLVTPYIGVISVTGRTYVGRARFLGCVDIDDKASVAQCREAGGKAVAGEIHLTASTAAYRVKYLRQDGNWVRDPSTSSPGGASVKDGGSQSELPPSWLEFVSGSTNDKP